jgi:hypothetical protein
MVEAARRRDDGEHGGDQSHEANTVMSHDDLLGQDRT